MFALVVQPAIGLLLGRSWRQAEIFGIAPNPTGIGTLGLLLALAGPARWALMVLPAPWCAATGATFWATSASDFWVPPAVALLTLALLTLALVVWRR